MRLFLICAVFVIATLVAASGAMAQTVPQCAIASISPLAFGQYNPFSAIPADFTTSVTVNCTRQSGSPSQRVSIRLDLSTGNYGTIAQRQMGSAVNRLNYNLFKDAARTTIWGTGTGSPSGITDSFNLGGGVGTVTSRTYIVYGRLPGSQNTAAVGSYLDQINVSLFAVFI